MLRNESNTHLRLDPNNQLLLYAMRNRRQSIAYAYSLREHLMRVNPPFEHRLVRFRSQLLP